MSLLTKEEMRILKKQLPKQEFKTMAYRRTGRTTAAALRTIADCIQNPGTPYVVMDHYGTKESDKNFLRVISLMVLDLGFQHFQFNMLERTVCFGWVNPYNEVSKE